MLNNNFKNKNLSGYTIIETMIATSLFLVIVIYGMGSLLNANLIHKKSENSRAIMDNLNFVMEDISRNLRTGSSYHCLFGNDTLANSYVPTSCTEGWGIAFESASGSSVTSNDQWVYYIDEGKLFKSTDNGGSGFVQLTPDEIVLDELSYFSVLGAEGVNSENAQQPFVSIHLIGSITSKDGTLPFSLQTSMSQRVVDI